MRLAIGATESESGIPPLGFSTQIWVFRGHPELMGFIFKILTKAVFLQELLLWILNLYSKLLMESYSVAKFMYLTELFPSWAFSIFILAICMFLSNTRFKLVRLLVSYKRFECGRDRSVRLSGSVKLFCYWICMLQLD